MSHPSNNNRVKVNGEVAAAEETALGVAGTSKARETRLSLPSNPNLRLAPPNHLLLLPRLLLLTPSSSVTSHPRRLVPSSAALIILPKLQQSSLSGAENRCHPHHSDLETS